MGAEVLQFMARFASSGPCPTCGVEVVLPADYRQHRINDHKPFHCPNGHAQSFNGKSEAERLREELAAKERTIAWKDQQIASAQKAASAARGQVTAIKNRVGNGVCPCCNRSFQNVQRHMKTKHPAFAKDGE